MKRGFQIPCYKRNDTKLEWAVVNGIAAENTQQELAVDPRKHLTVRMKLVTCRGKWLCDLR